MYTLQKMLFFFAIANLDYFKAPADLWEKCMGAVFVGGANALQLSNPPSSKPFFSFLFGETCDGNR